MNWVLLDSGFNTGNFNMNYDLELTEKCGSETAFFRLYRWEPYCISLGANQSFDDLNLEKLEQDGLEAARRPTGGRAILHSEEITYSVVLPLTIGLTAKEIYNKISKALINGLKKYNPLLAEAELENLQPNFPDLLKQPSGMLCFASTAKNEVKFHGRKIIGSAQRKMNKVVLQHGSILCGTFHRKLPDYLNTGEDKTALNMELESKTIEIETILSEKVDYSKLKEALIEGFAEEWEITFMNDTERIIR